jgi:hypothetical protein
MSPLFGGGETGEGGGGGGGGGGFLAWTTSYPPKCGMKIDAGK